MQDANLAARYAELRRMMIDCQVRPFDVTDQAVLGVMQSVPRELFVDAGQAEIAYSDANLTVSGASEKRRLLTPMVLARLLQNAGLTRQSRVLDVAGANGYSAAVIAGLAGSVVALESDVGFTARARANFAQLGLTNAEAVTGPLEGGAPAQGPFDVIVVNGVAERGLETLLSSLKPGGRLMVLGRAPGQTGRATRATRYDFAGGSVGSRALFDAAGAVLGPFKASPAFAF